MTKYWLVAGGEAKRIQDSIEKRIKEFDRHCTKMKKKYKAKALWVGNHIQAMDFDGGKCPDGWVSHDRRRPWLKRPPLSKSKYKAHKEAIDDFKRVNGVTSETIGREFLGAEMAAFGLGLISPGYEKLPDGRCVVIAEESKTWKPVKGLREIKASTYYKLKGE